GTGGLPAPVTAASLAGGLPRPDGPPATTFEAQAETYPLRERWAPLPGTERALDARGVRPQFLDHVAETVARTVQQEPDGDVLVFLPGAREIQRVTGHLQDRLSAADPVEILPLLG